MTEERFTDEGTALSQLRGEVDVRCPSCDNHAVVRRSTDDRSAKVTCGACSFAADETAGWLGPVRGWASKRCGRCQQLVERHVPGPRHPHPVPLTCECGYRTEADVTWSPAPSAPFDPAFGLDLWFTEPFRGEVLWAYNRRHLQLLRDYVGATQRERIPNRNSSIASRLPGWIKDAKNRDALLATIAKLEART